MEQTTSSILLQTNKTEWKREPAPGSPRAMLVQIYPPSLSMGARHQLGDSPQDIGRGDRCAIRLDHGSVSRRHALVKPQADGYCVLDLDSTNGTFVNNVQVQDAMLHDGDYLRIGSCIFRFLAGSNMEAEYHEEIYRLTIFDGLTEVHNKRYFFEYLTTELARCIRHRRALSVVLFDLDHFKRINDEQGHLCGDHTLREVAARIKRATRKEELLARYGGEEFAVVLPETNQENAAAMAERVRALVGTEPFTYDDVVFTVTVSLGVATTAIGQAYTAEQLILQADEALYSAKDAGRNCVCVHPLEVPPPAPVAEPHIASEEEKAAP